MMPDGSARWRHWLTPAVAALLAWAVMSIILLVIYRDNISAVISSDPDDAMRMVQVRDLLAGQQWWDLTQHRVNPAHGGVLMHWSRIVDAPIATGILLLEPLLGQARAEQVVMTIWPLVMGALLSLSCALGFRNLSDRRIAFVVPLFLIMLGFIVIQFRPMRVDHHGWQILLSMVILWQAIRAPGRQAGLLGGLGAAALLAISIEGLPIVTLFAGLAALRWAWFARAADRDWLRHYMAALAGGGFLLQFLTRGPAGILGSWCDALSAPYLAAFGIAAVATLAITSVAPSARAIRLLALAGAGILAVGGALWIEPACAKGPFGALDPIVVKYWYLGVLEGQPIWASAPDDRVYLLVPSLLGLAGAILAWHRSENEADCRNWTTIILAMSGALLVSLFVMRTASVAHLYGLPGCAWVSLRAWDRARAIVSPPLRILATAAAAMTPPLPASIVVAALLGGLFPAMRPDVVDLAALDRDKLCFDTKVLASLDRLAPSIAMTPNDMGAPLLFSTHLRVVVTGHHRNNEAMADTITAFISDPATAEPIVRKQKADFVIFCRSANDLTVYRKANAQGLAARLYAGKPPAWLESVAIGGDRGLSVWRVKPAS